MSEALMLQKVAEIQRNVVSAPPHYTFSKYQPKDVIREWNLNFNLGNAVKYIVRAGKKAENPSVVDLRKAIQYLEFEIEYLEANE